MSEALLQVAGLHAWYGESHVLHGVDFAVKAGEVVTARIGARPRRA
jgi:branched-chain amino acid transport system ATP-binding protein